MSEGMGYHAEGGELVKEEENMLTEIKFHQGTPKAPLYNDPMSASAAAKKIQEFTNKWADPFSPSYAYANPWSNKKDNKGKKERPAGPVKPKPADVTL